MPECEFSMSSRQPPDRQPPDIDNVTREVRAWTNKRIQCDKSLDWRFASGDAHIHLKRLDPERLDG